MDNSNFIQMESQSKVPEKRGNLDPLVILTLILKNWYFILFGILACMAIARFYIGHTMPVYRTSATILINENENRPIVDNSDLLQGLGLPGGMENIENQIMVLSSRALVETTLESFPLR